MEFNRSCNLVNRYLLDKDYTFELIEDNKIDIDIQAIEEIEWDEINGVGEEQDKFILRENERYLCSNYDDFEMVSILKINRLIQAVKQLNKEIKSIKEK